MNFAKFLRTSFFTEQLRWPLLKSLPFTDTLVFKIRQSWKVETTRLLSTKYVLNVLKWELISGNHLQMACEWIACWNQEQLKWSTEYDCHFHPANQKLLSGIIGKSNVYCHVDIWKVVIDPCWTIIGNNSCNNIVLTVEATGIFFPVNFAKFLKGSLHTTMFWKYTELFNILKIFQV